MRGHISELKKQNKLCKSKNVPRIELDMDGGGSGKAVLGQVVVRGNAML